MKKPSILLLLTTALIAQQSAVAQLPLSAQVLGQLDETISFCSRVKPEQAKVIEAASDKFFLALSPKELEIARRSSDYKKARVQAKEKVSELDKAGIASTCTILTK